MPKNVLPHIFDVSKLTVFNRKCFYMRSALDKIFKLITKQKYVGIDSNNYFTFPFNTCHAHIIQPYKRFLTNISAICNNLDASVSTSDSPLLNAPSLNRFYYYFLIYGKLFCASSTDRFFFFGIAG